MDDGASPNRKGGQRVIPVDKRIRVVAGGGLLADSSRTRLLLEAGKPPVYYFPPAHIDWSRLAVAGEGRRDSTVGEISLWSLKGGTGRSPVAWSIVSPRGDTEPLKDYVGLDWGEADAWFEEEDEVFVHPRDPFTRVDVVQSSRHLKVILGGVVVAESRQPLMLFETGLPTRYYIPKLHSRMDLLRPGSRVTRCPYKGEAHYYSVEVDGRCWPDIGWYYSYPQTEVSAIATRLCFYQERVDAMLIDGDDVSG